MKKVYWAGALFNAKELIGNRLLADAFDAAAAGRWQAVLPQESEANALRRTEDIRDDDLEQLFSADAIVANFDGTELDSGTVAEFCFAKFLDLPAVLLRTDFRKNGDGMLPGSDPWNLMCSHYPRTETVLYNAMTALPALKMAGMFKDIAEKVVSALDRCAAVPPLFSGFDARLAAFRHALCAAGGSMRERFPDERIAAILKGEK